MVPNLPRRCLPRVLPSLLCAVFLTVQAQPAATPRRPDPLDPKAAVPALRYESATVTHRRLSDDKPLAWRDANDAVARIGGWRVYAREAQLPDPPSSAPAPAPAPSQPAGRRVVQ